MAELTGARVEIRSRARLSGANTALLGALGTNGRKVLRTITSELRQDCNKQLEEAGSSTCPLRLASAEEEGDCVVGVVCVTMETCASPDAPRLATEALERRIDHATSTAKRILEGLAED